MTATEYRSPEVGAPAVEMTWTCIAADTDGVPDADAIGVRTLERVAAFAWKAEAEAWAVEQAAEGFTVHGPTPYATYRYHGPTDAPSNCWIVRGERAAAAAVQS